ncbi:bifunctional UDP-N-acetylglucosamine diphosphorylase/glucosamine-1-phosphate N-acetyltransferase GlmU [endosymbiont of Ridgeia piscesae]|jgi:bifunctional UDP-N-acetylglucosamine pyrophosphorylase/glucosamine-1-phosphate N-acetyltransferase|uniref:Bifunctional protein GlmU n=1 Tax=endosymbiont of Ridgeia piscesae TaxID=54398 RepID=A0A0T5YTV6_9GAMM|nr:bifunctional UDP-N-acetylglucosamine diphosphorylase/glucosamine-1-phosphate N-acetyltransferase GlmU [endosymbiont of Ridgeia piscesae]KRT54047.1 UDP-N-acetylglucosamine pyrophosphorylase [endosymbiont of Ridgeia piscesae]KRT60242.1 UDP-N-acetylglucosamine pyrophosphorylase /glucosamine-1-phosphate N-acetyltransferase [endosymbiont of Ridgeia piscesae]
MKLGVLILAAGQGTRMRSNLPKVLHKLAGQPLLEHVVKAAQQLEPEQTTIIYGHGGEQVRTALQHYPLAWCEQRELLGTGHAVMQAESQLADLDAVLILYGDVPLIDTMTIRNMVEHLSQTDLVLLTVSLNDPSGYGRIVRDNHGKAVRIVEQKDATQDELEIAEINTGIMALNRVRLDGWLREIENDNAQKEYYLTDVIELAVNDGVDVFTVNPNSEEEVMGVNDRVQLSHLERHYQRELAEKLMQSGVTIADPARIDIRGELKAGKDVFIDCNAIFEGEVELGDGVTVGPNALIKNSKIAEGVQINANCVIEDAEIGANSRIGPFARIRPETHLADSVHVGNFVEVKKSEVGSGSKINHLSYIGDSIIGSKVNVGAGTITCNYDGANKHQTVIGDNAFIGSDSQLVAPVIIGEGATIGAGSTVTRDAPSSTLTLSRAKQITVAGWKRPEKNSK